MIDKRRGQSFWVAQCFRDRGIKGQTTLEIQLALQAMPEAILVDLIERMRRIAAGTERSDDIGCAKTLIAQHIPAPAHPVLPATPVQTSPAVAPSAFDESWPAEIQPSPGQPGSESPSKPTSEKAQLRAFGHHAYGTKAALKIELDLAKPERDGQVRRHTVHIEIAPNVSGVRNRYDWSRKIPFQFTQDELPVLSATLLGLMPGPLRFANHGPDANKTFTLEFQKTVWFLKLSEGARVHAIQLGSGDIHAWAGLCLTALKRNYGELDGQMHALMLQAVARMHPAGEAA